MITLITVNYNNAGATMGLLRSLELQSDREFDIIVVENGSSPGDRAELGAYAATSPLNMDLLLSETNRGFSGGNNLAIRKALAQGSTWLMLINNDTTVTPDFIARVRAQLPDEPSIVGIALDEGSRTAYAGIVQWLRSTLSHIYDHSQLSSPSSRLQYAIGAGMAVHRDALARIGLLDERYFLYFEDADFSLRARRAGIPLRFLKEPVIFHGVSASTRHLGSPLLLYYHARNALLFNRLHGPWWIRKSLPAAALYGIVHQLLKMLLMPSRRPESRAIAFGIIDFYARRFGKIKDTQVPRVQGTENPGR